MFTWWRVLALSAVSCLLLAVLGWAADDSGAETQRDADIRNLALAYRLAEMGRGNKAPEAMITAASLLRELSELKMTALRVKPVILHDEEATTKGKLIDEMAAAPNLGKQADDLFDEALLLGRKQKLDLTKLVEAARKRKPTRIAVAGPIQQTRVIGPGQFHTFRRKVRAGKVSRIAFVATAPLGVTVEQADVEEPLADMFRAAGAAIVTPPGAGESATIEVHFLNSSSDKVTYTVFMN